MPGLQEPADAWSVDTRGVERFLGRLLQEISLEQNRRSHNAQQQNQSLLTMAQGLSGAPQQQTQQQQVQPGQPSMAQQQMQSSMRPPEPTPPPQGQYPTQWRRGTA